MMYEEWKEIGIRIIEGSDGGGTSDSIYIAENFALRSDTGPFLTGVAYEDFDADGFHYPEIPNARGEQRHTRYVFRRHGWGTIPPARVDSSLHRRVLADDASKSPPPHPILRILFDHSRRDYRQVESLESNSVVLLPAYQVETSTRCAIQSTSWP